MSTEDVKVEDFTSEFCVEDASTQPSNVKDRETDAHRIGQRQKQIDFGKNTVGYQRYRQGVPLEMRTKKDPRTPDVHQVCSKRAFDGQVRKWRRALHSWDLPGEDANVDLASPQALEEEDSKNEFGTRQSGALPLKIPSAMRPMTKRGRTTNAMSVPTELVLTSPTMAPPEAKHPRKTWADTVQMKGTIAGDNALMTKWKEMAVVANSSDADHDQRKEAMWEGAPELCYSDDEVQQVSAAEPMVVV